MARDRYARQRQSDDDPPVFRPGSKSKDSDRESDRPKPLGVPEGYKTQSYSPFRYTGGFDNYLAQKDPEHFKAPGVGQGRMIERGPRYNEGDEWKPANNSPAGIAEAQKYLAAAGLLEDWRWGVWDEATRKAWAEVLGYANSRGITDQMALQELATAPPSGGGGGGGSAGGSGGGGGEWTVDENGNPVQVQPQFVPPPLQIRLPSREDVGRVLRHSVIDLLGMGWSQAEIDELTDLYMSKVREPQEAAYAQEVDRMEDEFYGRPGQSEPITTVEAPSLETFAEDELRRRDPAGFGATQVAEDFAPAFFSALGGYV